MVTALLAALTAAQPQAGAAEDANWRIVEPALRQMIGEAHALYAGDDFRGGRSFTVLTRARASDEGGVCARDELRIRIARPDDPPDLEEGVPARIRDVEIEHQFHILRTDEDEPRWDLAGEALERACAVPREGSFNWIRADSAEDAKAAVLGLLAVRRALAEPGSPLIRARCSGARCFDRTRIALEPFDMSAREPLRSSRCGGARRYRCQVFIVLDMGACAVWHLEMETEWEPPYRVRSATFVDRGAIHHCPADDG